MEYDIVSELLITHCIEGDLEGVKQTLSAGGNVEYVGDEQLNPLELSIAHERDDIVKYFVNQGVKINEISFIIAIDLRREDIVKLLFRGNVSEVSFANVFVKLYEELDEDESLGSMVKLISDCLREELRLAWDAKLLL